MKQLIFYILSMCLLVGCIGKDSETAKMILNVDTINFCNRPLGETVIWNDIQITNPGNRELTLSKIAVRGDDTCAFQVFYPDETAPGKFKTRVAPQEQDSKGFKSVIVPPDRGIVLKVAYTPSDEGVTDRADLVLTSDAVNLMDNNQEAVNTVVPMCGVGASVASDMVDIEDAGVEDGGDVDGGLPCPECGKALDKGAPGCEAGYDPIEAE